MFKQVFIYIQYCYGWAAYQKKSSIVFDRATPILYQPFAWNARIESSYAVNVAPAAGILRSTVGAKPRNKPLSPSRV
jgi:hypothetical protein